MQQSNEEVFTPQSFSADGSWTNDKAYLRCQRSNSWQAHLV